MAGLDGANPVGSVFTSLPYSSTNAIQLAAAAGDVHVFVDEVSTEIQITDSSTGVILIEALDRRVGQHSMLNMGSTWANVNEALAIRTTRISVGLDKARKDT